MNKYCVWFYNINTLYESFDYFECVNFIKRIGYNIFDNYDYFGITTYKNEKNEKIYIMPCVVRNKMFEYDK